MFLIDAHLDLAMNAMEWNRDLRQPVDVIRRREAGLEDKPDRGRGTVSLPELRKGNIGLVVATQIARYVDETNPLPGWNSPQQAWAQTQGQLAWYREMEDCGEMRKIKDLTSLESHLDDWNKNAADEKIPIGFILSLEGADSIVEPAYLYEAYDYGLRALGPAHYGPGRYANGTDAVGGLNEKGIALLSIMEELNIILDATHLCDDAFYDAMELYHGPVWASHHNCRSIVNHNRQLSDEMIKILLQKNAVIGMAFDAWMMVPGWERGKSNPKEMNCGLEQLALHIDHICQLAGNSRHVGIGSDLDGGFGTEQTPVEIKTISDVQKLTGILSGRGYSNSDIENIFSKNWLSFLRSAWA
jgi:membrane dipeptidase